MPENYTFDKDAANRIAQVVVDYENRSEPLQIASRGKPTPGTTQAVMIVAGPRSSRGWFPGVIVYYGKRTSTTTTVGPSTTTTPTTSSTTTVCYTTTTTSSTTTVAGSTTSTTTTSRVPAYSEYAEQTTESCWLVIKLPESINANVGDVFHAKLMNFDESGKPIFLVSDRETSLSGTTTLPFNSPSKCGTCEYTWDSSNKKWNQTKVCCTGSCKCLAPQFCPPSGSDCTVIITQCANTPNHQKPVVCNTSTTTSTTTSATTTLPGQTTTSTTTTSPCYPCKWTGAFGTWTLTESIGCPYVDSYTTYPDSYVGCGNCSRPATLAPTDSCVYVTTPCLTPLYSPPPPPFPCGGGCTYGLLGGGNYVFIGGGCSGGSDGSVCNCDIPPDSVLNGPYCGKKYTTPCYCVANCKDSQPTTSTTTTDSCGGKCTWRVVNAGGLTWYIAGNTCNAGCICYDPPVRLPSNICDIDFGPCTRTTTTTSSTTTPPGTTTTTTTSVTSSTTSTTTTVVPWNCYNFTTGQTQGPNGVSCQAPFNACMQTASITFAGGGCTFSGTVISGPYATQALCTPACPAATTTTSTTTTTPITSTTTTAAPTTTTSTTTSVAATWYCYNNGYGCPPGGALYGCDQLGPTNSCNGPWVSLSVCSGHC